MILNMSNREVKATGMTTDQKELSFSLTMKAIPIKC